MATLFPSPTEPSSIQSAADFEPDEQWKTRLKLDIENNLRSMVDEAKQNLSDTLKKAPVSALERDRLSDEHLATMKNIRNLAEEKFRIALERERQERRWAAGQTLDREWSESMMKEQQAILDKIERERKDKPAHSSSSSSAMPIAGASESRSGPSPERALWTPQENTEFEHEADYFPRLATRELEDDHVPPRDTGKARAGSVSNGVGSYKPLSTLDTTDRGFERPKPSPTIDELDDMPRSARSATNAADSIRRGSLRRKANLSTRQIPEFWLPSITPEEDAQMSRTFSIARRGAMASTTSLYRAPSVFNTSFSAKQHDMATSAMERERDRISVVEQEWSSIDGARDGERTTSYTYAEARPSRSSTPQPMYELRRKEEEARRRQEKAEQEEEAQRKEAEIRRKEEDARKKEEEIKRQEKHKIQQEEFRKREEEIRRQRAEEKNTSRSSATWMSSTRPSSTASSQPSTIPKPLIPSAQQNPKAEQAQQREEQFRREQAEVEQERLTKTGKASNKQDTIKPFEQHHRWNNARDRAKDLGREEEERRVAPDLLRRLAEERRKEDEVKRKEGVELKEFRGVYAKEEEIRKEEELAPREKQCNNLASDHDETMQPQAQSLLNIFPSSSLETTATEEETSQELPGSASNSLKDLTNELQGRSLYPITSGGFGDIWKCVLAKSSETVPVAVKTIRAFETDNEVLMRRNAKKVRRELKVWGRLKHYSILPLWGVANDFGPYPAMICPWADNGALTGFLERQQDMLSLQDKFSLLNDIALGLQYLHSKSVVHGDLTGSNVLIYANGRACLADFGLSTIIQEFIGTSYFTSTNRGNIRWVAAELCEASEDDQVLLSTECDIYSFGSITLQVFTCKVPYYNVRSDIAVLTQIIQGKKPEPPKESQIAPGHWEIIQRCWLPRASRPSVGEIVAFVECERQALSS